MGAPDIMHTQLLISKGQCNDSCNFTFHYKSDKVKKMERKLGNFSTSFFLTILQKRN